MVFDPVLCYNDHLSGASAAGFSREKIMTIVQTVNLYQFRQAFVDAGRKEQFSYEGLEFLYDYLENLSDDIGEPIELDVIALCCDYAENHYSVIAADYGIDLSEAEGDEDEEFGIVLDYLHENTSVCGYDEEMGVIVYALF